MKRIGLFLVIILAGLVVAAPTTVTNLLIDDFVAGGTSVATFAFEYLNNGQNLPDASLILRVNMSSLEENCPLNDCSVWKDDFSMSGFIEQFPLFGYLFMDKVTPLQCLEQDDINFLNSNGVVYTHHDGTAGTFYCYDPSNYLNVMDLDRRDEVTLEVSSNYALYPGEYGITVELMEIERDVSPPVMELILSELLFSEGDIIPIRLNVSDMYNIMSVEYEIMNPDLSEYYSSSWIAMEFNESSGLYEDDFDMDEYDMDESGSYWIKARACDILGNCGEL